MDSSSSSSSEVKSHDQETTEGEVDNNNNTREQGSSISSNRISSIHTYNMLTLLTLRRRRRNVHSDHSTKKEEKASRMFENFVVVGIPTDPQKQTHVMGNFKLFEPQVLWHFPSTKQPPKKLAEFCFPSAIATATVRRTPSLSNLNQILMTQYHIYDINSCFIFRLNGDNEILYGICVIKEELLEEHPSFFEVPTKSLAVRTIYTTAPRCYCIVTRFPFFTLHFHAILSVLAQDNLNRLTNRNEEFQQPSRDTLISEMLDAFYKSQVPDPGQSITLQLPGDPRSFTYSRPNGDDDSNLLSEWGLITMFKILSLENLLLLYNALLVEKPVVIVCKNLHTLSSVVLSVVPLLKPFAWQGLLIPVLPQNLVQMLQAPVPFVIGVQKLPIEPDGVVIDLDRNRVHYSNVGTIPKLPEMKKIMQNVRPAYLILHKEGSVQEYHNPNLSTPQLKQAAQTVLDAFSNYLNWFSEKVKSHFVTSPQTDRDELQKGFVQKVLPANRDFVTMFLSTQLFSVYCDNVIMPLKTQNQ